MAAQKNTRHADREDLYRLGYKQELRRMLGLFSSFSVQFSMIAVGSALFLTLPLGLHSFGPAMFWSWVVAGGFQLLLGLAVAQLVSAYPLAGGVYQVIGRLTRRHGPAWLTGWLLLIAHIVSLPALAVGMAPYIAGWFDVTLHGTRDVLVWTVGLIALVTLINLTSVKISSFVNNLAVVAEIAGFTLVIVALLVVRHPTQPLDFLTNSAGTAQGGWIGPFLLAALVPGYVISSFDSSGNASEETLDAARTAPKGLILANTTAYVIGTLGLALILLAVETLPAVMNSSQPMKLIISSSVGTGVANIFVALVMAALVGAMVMLQLTAARILFAQARDGQLPFAGWFRKLNKEATPANATVVSGVLAIGFAAWSPLLSTLTAMTALAWTLGYTAAAAIGLRALHTKRLPHCPWNYGAWSLPIFWIATVWGAVLCVILVWPDVLHIGVGIAGVIVTGLIIYRFIPASRRGRVAHEDAPEKRHPGGATRTAESS
ncbi:APC family permease [Streptomyces sp. NPDC003442]